eukprot:gb/GECG01003832.1/.p1 GENE.gb/GECG01003832.1/~~gb/GECG01003832.1/.p1  ORF type:complete len:907 (+),score=118.01 gb/GECG01003832.1/:1-2721(+)
MASIEQALQQALSPDHQQRTSGEQTLQQAEQQYPVQFFQTLSTIVCGGEQIPSAVRQLAALQLKNALHSSRNTELRKKQDRWKQIDHETKGQVKMNLLNTLAQQDAAVSRAVAQALAKIALVELPTGEFGEVIPQLVSAVRNDKGEISATARAGCLICLGYICDEADLDMIKEEHTRLIIDVTVSVGMYSEDVSVRRAATQAAYHALFFAGPNFEDQKQRDAIMTSLLRNAEDGDQQVRLQAYSCLNLSAKQYYHFMGSYMEKIFHTTIATVKNESDPAVAASAVEFWISIAEVEADIAEGELEGPSGCFIQAALVHLCQMIQFILKKQDEEQEDDTINVATMGGVLLKTIARLHGAEALQNMGQYIENGFQHQEWRDREAATLALGCLLETPDSSSLASVVQKALPPLVQRLARNENGERGDPHVYVRDTSAWAVGMMVSSHWQSFLHLCEVQSGASTQPGPFFHQTLHSIYSTLEDDPKVALNGCYILHNMAENLGEESGAKEQNLLSGSYGNLLEALFKAAERDDAEDSNLRSACFETITMLVQTAPTSEHHILRDLFPVCLEKLERAIGELRAESAIVSDQRQRLEGQQIVMCSVLQCLVLALGAPILQQPYPKRNSMSNGDVSVQLFLNVLHSNSTTSQEEALMALGSVAGALERDFKPYFETVHTSAIACLERSDNHQLVIHTANLLCEMARGLGPDILSHAPEYLDRLLRILHDADVDKSAKPPLFGAIGDIALALGVQFHQFATYVMKTLLLFNGVDFPEDDEDEQEYVLNLRKELCDSYVSICMAYKDDTGSVRTAEVEEIKPYLYQKGGIIDFMKRCYNDLINNQEWQSHELVMSLAGLMGDLADVFGKDLMKQHGVSIGQPWVQQTLTLAYNLEQEQGQSENSIAVYAKNNLDQS